MESHHPAAWAAATAILAAAGAVSAQPQYTITPILYPEAGAFIEDLNDAGQVPIMAFNTFSSDHKAYVWQNGSLTSLPPHPLTSDVGAVSIDENGVVYGEYQDPGGTFNLPMRWVNGIPEDLPLASQSHRVVVFRSSATTGVVAAAGHTFPRGTPGWTNIYGWGSGTSAEPAFGAEDPWRALLYDAGAGVRRVLPRMPMGLHSMALDVNDAGQAVVQEQFVDRTWALLIDPERGVIDLGGFGPGVGDNGRGTGASPAAINETGQVVGYSYLGFAAKPFLWENGVMTDLGLLPGFAEAEALDINDHGDIVGRTRHTIDPVRYNEDGAFLYRDGVMHNLQDLVPPGSGWQLTRAVAINNSGQILVAERLGGVFSSRYAILRPQ